MSFLAGTIVAPLFEDGVCWEVDLAVLANNSVGPYEYGCVVDYPLDTALFRHAKHDMQPMLSSELLDSLDAGSRNRLGQIVHLVLHRITGKMKLRKYDEIDTLLSRYICLCGDCFQVLFLLR